MAGLNTAQIISMARDRGIQLSDAQAQEVLSQAWDQGQWGADAGKVGSLLGNFSSGTNSFNNPDDILGQAKQAVEEWFKPYEEAANRSKQFDENNPFVFDEALARGSAEERFLPFYQAELREFTTGVNRQRGRTVQDEEALRKELTADTESFVGRTRRQIDQALESSREGFAGAGLYFGGRRQRAEGEIGIEGDATTADFMRGQDRKTEQSQLRQTRGLQDLDLQSQQKNRLLGAERETSIRTDIETQRKEEQARREIERQQFVGYPLTTGTQSLQSLLGFV